MKLSARIVFLWLVLLPTCSSAMARDFTWTGMAPGTPKMWNNPANWFPNTGYPVLSGDRAFFNRTSSASCILPMQIAIAELRIESSYMGTISLTLNGQLTVSHMQLDGGNFVSDPERVTAIETLTVSRGSFTDLTCMGTATITDGAISTLRMRGLQSRLQSVGELREPHLLGALIVPEGKCTMTHVFVVGTLDVGTGATLVLDPLGSLTATTNSIAGSIKLASGSRLSLLSDSHITGRLDASAPGTAISCTGNWTATGSFVASGSLSSTLLITQTASSGTINHGVNPADAVAVQGAAGKTTTWVSSNSILQLTISSDTILEIAPGSVLGISGAIVNASVLREIAPGRIHHNAEELQAVNDAQNVLLELPINRSFRIRLRDADEALRADTADTAEGLSIVNTRNGDRLQVNAVETGSSTAAFLTSPVATRNAADAVADDMLQLLPGDLVTVRYIDNEDPEDNNQILNIRGEGSTTTLPTTTTTTSTGASTTSTVFVTTTSTTTTTTGSSTSTTGVSTTTTTLPPSGPSSRLEFAHLAAGGGYQSFLVINNPNTQAVQGLAVFRAQDGQPLTLQINGEPGFSTLFVVPGRGTIRLRLQSSSEQVLVGWCRVTADAPIGGMLVYQLLGGGTLISEASVLPSMRLKHFSLPVTQLGFLSDTGLAIANVDNEVANISMSFIAVDGRLIEQAVLRREPGEQVARFVGQFFTGIQPAAEGSIEIFSDKELAAVGLLFHGGIFTTLPILPLP